MTSRFLLLVSVIVCGTVASTPKPASADPVNRDSVSLVASPLVIVPVGRQADNLNVGLGGTVGAEVPVGEGPISVVIAAGYVYHLDKKLSNDVVEMSSRLPLWIGVKYDLLERVYVEADLGLSIARDRLDDAAGKGAVVTNYVAAANAGVGYHLGFIDLSAMLVTELEAPTKSTSLMFQAAFKLPLIQ